MRVRLSVYTSLIFSLFIQCKEDPDFTKYEMPHIGASIKLPSSYTKLTEKRLKKENSIIQKIYNSNKKQTILIDTVNNNNLITILPVTYQKIDSTVFYLLIDHQRKKSSKTIIVDSVYYVGSVMGSIGNYKYIESKHQGIKKNNTELVVKSVIISSTAKTIGISFFSEKNQDIGPFINTIKAN